MCDLTMNYFGSCPPSSPTGNCEGENRLKKRRKKKEKRKKRRMYVSWLCGRKVFFTLCLADRHILCAAHYSTDGSRLHQTDLIPG